MNHSRWLHNPAKWTCSVVWTRVNRTFLWGSFANLKYRIQTGQKLRNSHLKFIWIKPEFYTIFYSSGTPPLQLIFYIYSTKTTWTKNDWVHYNAVLLTEDVLRSLPTTVCLNYRKKFPFIPLPWFSTLHCLNTGLLLGINKVFGHGQHKKWQWLMKTMFAEALAYRCHSFIMK